MFQEDHEEPRVGAVIFSREREIPLATSIAVPQVVIDRWIPRQTQIAMVETIAVNIALETFESGRLWGNTGCQGNNCETGPGITPVTLAELLRLEDKPEQAAELYDFVVVSLERNLGADDPLLIPIFENYTKVLKAIGDEEKATIFETRAMVMRVEQGLDFGSME